jgi:hypothetical protein
MIYHTQLARKEIRAIPYFKWSIVIDKLTPDPSFGHTLCFKCPNGSWKPILDIYIPKDFQWYKKHLNPMGFDPCNCPLKIWESIRTPTPKVGIHLGVWEFIPSHFLTLPRAWNVTPGLPSWPAPLQALALVANPKFGLQHKTIKSHLQFSLRQLGYQETWNFYF